MHFVLLYEIVDNFAEKRMPFRNEHLAKVRKAHADSQLVLAGAFADPVDGALLIFRGPTRDAAEAFAKADPYVINRLVTKWRVREWTTVVGKDAEVPLPPGM